MLTLLLILALFLSGFAIAYWSMHIHPRPRPFRYSHHTEPQLPAAATTSSARTLAGRYHLDEVVADCRNDNERIDALMRWVHDHWEPLAGRRAGTDNPLDLLARVHQGERFDRADYVTLMAHALQAVDLPTRVLELHTRDSHWRPVGGCYTGLEVFLRDQHRWCWVDARYDAVIMEDGQYCNALEIKDALVGRDHRLELVSAGGLTDIDDYLAGLAPFLDILIARPLGQARRYALIPPQLSFARRHHGLGRVLYDQACHSREVFYTSHPISQLVPTPVRRPAFRPQPISA